MAKSSQARKRPGKTGKAETSKSETPTSQSHVYKTRKIKNAKSKTISQTSKSNRFVPQNKKSIFIIILFLFCLVLLWLIFARHNSSMFAQMDKKHSKATSFKDTKKEVETKSQMPHMKSTSHNPTWHTFELLDTFPHDPSAFTQGLTTYNGKIYESTGLYGKSQIRQIDPKDGSIILQSHSLDEAYFGEGLTHYVDDEGNDLMIQLTWKEKVGFIYNATNLEVLRTFRYDTQNKGEGWGITYDEDSKHFIVSDGSDWLHFWDRDTLEETKRIQVVFYQPSPNNNHRDGNEQQSQSVAKPVKFLNELEFVNGRVLANIWYQDIVASIDPSNGIVDRLIDFRGLYTNRDAGADCFNGISRTNVEGEFLVTGKLWPNMYKVKIN